MPTMESAEELAARLAAVEAELARLRAQTSETVRGETGLVEVLLRDNARRREAEQQLAFAQEWMQLAQEAGGVGAYFFDMPSGDLRWSASTYALYGWKPGRRKPGLKTWLKAVHPDDRARVQKAAAKAMAHGREIRQEYRIRMPDGRVRWIQDRARVTLDAKGAPQRIYGLAVDVTDLKRLEQALRESEQGFRYTFEHAAVGVCHVGLDGRFLQVNDALCQFLGRTREELLGLTFQAITHPDDLGPDLAWVDRILGGEVDSFTMEKRYLRPDGTDAWASLTVSLRRGDDDTPLNFISIIADIGARKTAEARAEFAMRELVHRSRNLLTVVQSIVHQSARHAPDAQTLASDTTQRLIAMAASQDLLVHHASQGAPIRELVRRQLAGFVDPDDPRVTLVGTDLLLTPQAAETLGLAVHELATNACKYGALTSPSGKVVVEWDGLPGQETGARGLRMQWIERDGPPVAPPKRTGFGRRVTEQMVRAALGAEVSLSFAAEGVVWTVDAPDALVDASRPAD